MLPIPCLLHLDAARIEAWADTQNDDLANGLALSKNAHWMSDEGLWSADDNLRIITAPLVTCSRADFLALASGQPGAGLIVLIRRRTRQAECAHLLALIEQASKEGLRGNVNFA